MLQVKGLGLKVSGSLRRRLAAATAVEGSGACAEVRRQSAGRWYSLDMRSHCEHRTYFLEASGILEGKIERHSVH